MSRRKKNPLDIKSMFNTLAKQLLEFGEEGKAELKDIVETHDPQAIFDLPSGPEKHAKFSAMVEDLKSEISDLSKERMRKQLPKRGAAAAAEPVQRAPRRAPAQAKAEIVEVPGVFERFKYVLYGYPGGNKWAAKITRQGRQIVRLKDEDPYFVDHPDLFSKDGQSPRLFNSKEDAELAVHRIIRKGLLWYERLGKTPPEKARRTEAGRAGIIRRTPEQKAQMTALQRQEAEAERQRDIDEARAGRVREMKVVRASGETPGQRSQFGQVRLQDVLREQEDRDRKNEDRKNAAYERAGILKYIPRNINPSTPSTYKYSSDVSLRQGQKSQAGFVKWYDKYKESKNEGKPNARALVKAYEHIENARVNYTAANAPGLSEKADLIKSELRKDILDLAKGGSGPVKNPPASTHLVSASNHMRKADEYWNQYIETGHKGHSLILAYKESILAVQEFLWAHADEERAIAQARMKMVERELMKLESN
jgi:hypothetical protein